MAKDKGKTGTKTEPEVEKVKKGKNAPVVPEKASKNGKAGKVGGKSKINEESDTLDLSDLSFDEDEWAEVEKRKEYAQGGGKLPSLGEHTWVCTKFEPGVSKGDKTAGARNFRVDLTVEEGSADDGARVVEFLIAAKSTAPRMVKAFEAFDVLDQYIKVDPQTKKKRLVPPTDKQCDSFLGLKVFGKVEGYEDQFRDLDKPSEERRQRVIFSFVRPAGKSKSGGALKSGKGGKKALAR